MPPKAKTKGKIYYKRPNANGVPYDKRKKQYWRTMGKFLDVDGKLRKQQFWYGRDKEQAEKKDAAVTAMWNDLQGRGFTYWTVEALCRLAEAGVIKIRQKRVVGQKPCPVDARALLKLEAVKQWVDYDGNVKPECVVAFQKYAVSQLIATDDKTQELLAQIQVLWRNDPLGTLERINRLGIAPHQLNVGIQTTGGGGINVFLADDPKGALPGPDDDGGGGGDGK